MHTRSQGPKKLRRYDNHIYIYMHKHKRAVINAQAFTERNTQNHKRASIHSHKTQQAHKRTSIHSHKTHKRTSAYRKTNMQTHTYMLLFFQLHTIEFNTHFFFFSSFLAFASVSRVERSVMVPLQALQPLLQVVLMLNVNVKIWKWIVSGIYSNDNIICYLFVSYVNFWMSNAGHRRWGAYALDFSLLCACICIFTYDLRSFTSGGVQAGVAAAGGGGGGGGGAEVAIGMTHSCSHFLLTFNMCDICFCLFVLFWFFVFCWTKKRFQSPQLHKAFTESEGAGANGAQQQKGGRGGGGRSRRGGQNPGGKEHGLVVYTLVLTWLFDCFKKKSLLFEFLVLDVSWFESLSFPFFLFFFITHISFFHFLISLVSALLW